MKTVVLPGRQSGSSARRIRSLRLWHCVVALLVTTAATWLVALWWLQSAAATAGLSLLNDSRTFTVDEPVTEEVRKLNDVWLQEVVQHCMQQQDTFIWLQQSSKGQQVIVWDERQLHAKMRLVDGRCALFHIPLASSDRSIGLCTDAALYAQLLGGWIVPATGYGLEHAQKCGYKSAAMFLEPLYEPWISWLQEQQHVVAVYAPNFEQAFGYDQAAHKRMRVVLCKVHRCYELMQKYLEDMHSTASLLYTGHTSIDPWVVVQQTSHTPTTLLSRRKPVQLNQLRHGQHQASKQSSVSAAGNIDMQQGRSKVAAAVQPLSVLHIRGKSSLKHTKQLLDCWLQHPDWPRLTMVGPMPNEQITGAEAQKYMAAPNIRAPNPGRSQGPNWPEFEPLHAAELAALLLSHPVHVMPSEREGFGHSINEGRAAGAVLLVPNHPPMSELVRDGSGVLLEPHLTFSHEDPPVPVLGKYGNISASMSPQGICDGMLQVLAEDAGALAGMGARARALFESDREAFSEAMREVLGLLHSLLEVAEAAAMMD